MAHRVGTSGYRRFVERLNRFPQGVAPTPLVYEILKVLMDEREAGLLARVPISPFTAQRAAGIWGMSETGARHELDRLCSRMLLVDLVRDGVTRYVLPPPMAGFFEFSLMRCRGDIDQQHLSELFYAYLNEEDDFIRELFCRGDTRLGRTFVHEDMLSPELEVLDWERASRVVEDAPHIGVSLCYCRHKMRHVGRACDKPLEICLTFNATASSLIRNEYARSIDTAEGLDLLARAREEGLVQFGENVRERVNFICNCCGCCCEALLAHRRFGLLHPVLTTGFLPAVDEEVCTGCGKCLTLCPVEAMALVSVPGPGGVRRRVARVDPDRCLGCGVCLRACSQNALSLVEREHKILSPLNTTHRVVAMAIERDTLQHLVCDDRVLFSHRALAAVLGVILRLPPLKRALASRQMQSRYLEALIQRFT